MILVNLMDVKFNKDDFIAEDKKLKIKDKIYITNLFVSSLIILGCGILNFQHGNSSLGTVFMVTGSNLLSHSFKIEKPVNNLEVKLIFIYLSISVIVFLTKNTIDSNMSYETMRNLINYFSISF